MAHNPASLDTWSEAYLEQLFAETERLIGPPSSPSVGPAVQRVFTPSGPSGPAPPTPPRTAEHESSQYKERFKSALRCAANDAANGSTLLGRPFAAAKGILLIPNPLLHVPTDAQHSIKLGIPVSNEQINSLRIKGLLAPSPTRGDGIEVVRKLQASNKEWKAWIRGEADCFVKEKFRIEGTKLRFEYAFLPETGVCGGKIKRDSVTTDGIGRLLVILPSFNYPKLKITNPKGGEPLTLGPPRNGEATLAIWYHGAETSISSSDPTLCLFYTILPPEEHNYHPSQLTIPKPTANLKQWLTEWKVTLDNDTEPICRRASYELSFDNSDQDLFLGTIEVFGPPPSHEMELIAEGLRRFPMDPALVMKIVRACVASQYHLKNKVQTVAKLFGPDSKGLSKFVQSVLKNERMVAEVRTTDFRGVIEGLGTNILLDLLKAFPPPPTITVDKSIPVRFRAGAAFMGWGIVFMEDVDLGRRSGTINPIRTQMIINSFRQNGLSRMDPENAIRVSICKQSLPIPPTLSLVNGVLVPEYPKLSGFRGARFLVEAGNHRLVALDGFLVQVGLSPEDRKKSGWWLAEIYNSDVVSQSPEIQRLVRAKEVSAAPPPTPPSSSQSAPVAHTFITPPFVAPPHATLGGTQPQTQASDSQWWVLNEGPPSARPRTRAPSVSRPRTRAPIISRPQAQASPPSQHQAQAPSPPQPQAKMPSPSRSQARVPTSSFAPAIKRSDSGISDKASGSNKRSKIVKVELEEAPKPDEASMKKKPWKIVNLDSDDSDE